MNVHFQYENGRFGWKFRIFRYCVPSDLYLVNYGAPIHPNYGVCYLCYSKEPTHKLKKTQNFLNILISSIQNDSEGFKAIQVFSHRTLETC